MSITLQSGFQVSENPKLIPEDLTQDLADIVSASYGPSRNPAKVSGYYCKEVSDLYTEYGNTQDALNDFAFRERILVIAKKLNIGPSLFRDQAYADTLSQLHKSFMIDTINYLKTGSRQLSIDTYTRIIRKGKERVDSKEIEDAYSDYNRFKLDQRADERRIYDLRTWTRREGGFADLLKTLWIVYGYRIGHVGG